jgi:hypothetical protein
VGAVPGAGAPAGPGPPPAAGRAGVDEQGWIERTADQLALTLADPTVRAELLTLLAGTKDERERQRRMESARRELASLEVRYPLLRGEDDAES